MAEGDGGQGYWDEVREDQQDLMTIRPGGRRHPALGPAPMDRQPLTPEWTGLQEPHRLGRHTSDSDPKRCMRSCVAYSRDEIVNA